jgi:hypothetical protein
MSEASSSTPDQLADTLSDQAIALCLGWFSFGAVGEVNISPPHAALAANKEGLDELVTAKFITHSHEAHRDIHTYKGSRATELVTRSARAKALLAARS